MPGSFALHAAAFAGGIFFANLITVKAEMMYGLAAALTGLAFWRLGRGKRHAAVVIAALFFIAGAIRCQQAGEISPLDVSRFAGRVVTVHGRVADLPRIAEIDLATVRERYVIAVEGVAGGPVGVEKADGALSVTVVSPRRDRPVAWGDRVTVSGRVLELHGYNNPGQIDAAASARLRGISGRMTAKPETFQVTPAGDGSWQAVFAGWRRAMVELVHGSVAPGDAAILTGVLFGGYEGIRREVARDFATTGLVHILSVSGAHIALVAGAALWAGARLRLRPGLSAACAAVLVVVYAAVAGFSPPVIRAVVMGLAALGAMAAGRPGDALQALAFAALGMLAYQPGLLWDISFQLSFGAAAGLVLLQPLISARLSFLPPWAAGPLAATAAAQLAVLPVLAWYFSRFPLSSFLANLIVLPIIETVVVAGLAAVVAAFAVPLAAKIALVCCAQFIGLAVLLTSWLAALPMSSVYLPDAGLAGATGYYLILAWSCGWLPRLPSPAAARRRPGRAAAVAALAVAALVIHLYYPRPLAVHFIDVGQGDATLVVTPRGRAVLIDTGGGGELAGFDVGERVVVPYLRHLGVRALDYLILTHGHQDHAGGAAAVAATIPVATFLLPQEAPSPAVGRLLRAGGGAGVIPARGGLSIAVDGVILEILHAPGDVCHARDDEESLAIRIRYGDRSFLVTGDLGPGGERELAAGLTAGDVLKVGHHGARTSTTKPLLDAFRPRLAVVSAGYGNRYGHPHPEVLERLAARGVAVYRTDRDGAVVVRTGGGAMTVETYCGGRK